MSTTRSPSAKRPRRKVGTRVRFLYGAGEVEAEVVEDRGYIGAGRRQIVRVRVFGDWGAADEGGEEHSFEMPAEDLTPVGQAPDRRRGGQMPRHPSRVPNR